MSFLNPLLLFAAIGVSLPILAHLLNRQKVRRTDWAAMQFLNRNVRVRSRQLRLRGLGGQIVLDPAPMAKKDRRQFETALRNAFRTCQVDTNLVGWTTLGHFELQRQRARSPLQIDLS